MPTACFTGHRQINGEYYSHDNPTKEWLALRNQLQATITSFVKERNVDHFISGMAIGVDSVAVESVALVRAFGGSTVNIVAAIPFPSQASAWPAAAQARWLELRGLCSVNVVVSADPYSPQKMQICNMWMVEHSDYVIAVWDGVQKGGTWNCIQYAQLMGKPVFHIHPITLATVWLQA